MTTPTGTKRSGTEQEKTQAEDHKWWGNTQRNLINGKWKHKVKHSWCFLVIRVLIKKKKRRYYKFFKKNILELKQKVDYMFQIYEHVKLNLVVVSLANYWCFLSWLLRTFSLKPEFETVPNSAQKCFLKNMLDLFYTFSVSRQSVVCASWEMN